MTSLLDVFLPTRCIFCGKQTDRVCRACEALLANRPRLVMRENLIGFAATDYSPDAKLILRSFKELGESALAGTLANYLKPLLGCFDSIPELLVPIPSNLDTIRERGFNPAELLARELCKSVPGLRWRNLLTRFRQTKDQSRLNPSQRLLNQRGSMQCARGTGSVLLVDDIVTTGATLIEAKRTLEDSGYFVTGFLAFAETESKKV